VTQLLLGVGLAALPGFVAYTDDYTVAYITVTAGAAAAGVALVTLITQWRWLAWVMGGISLWVLAAPLALSFQDADQALWSQLALGLALLATALADWAAARAGQDRNESDHAAPLRR
jgi:hypothetical protein